MASVPPISKAYLRTTIDDLTTLTDNAIRASGASEENQRGAHNRLIEKTNEIRARLDKVANNATANRNTKTPLRILLNLEISFVAVDKIIRECIDLLESGAKLEMLQRARVKLDTAVELHNKLCTTIRTQKGGGIKKVGDISNAMEAIAPKVEVLAEKVVIVANTPVVEFSSVPGAPLPPPITKAPAPIAKAPAPIAKAPAPIVNAPAPIAKAPAPIANAPAPIAKAPAPIANAPAPIANALAPIANALAPIANAPAPIVNAPVPIVNAPAPIANAPAPIVNAPPPIANAPAPIVNAPAPIVNAPAPIVNAPVALTEESQNVNNYPYDMFHSSFFDIYDGKFERGIGLWEDSNYALQLNGQLQNGKKVFENKYLKKVFENKYLSDGSHKLRHGIKDYHRAFSIVRNKPDISSVDPPKSLIDSCVNGTGTTLIEVYDLFPNDYIKIIHYNTENNTITIDISKTPLSGQYIIGILFAIPGYFTHPINHELVIRNGNNLTITLPETDYIWDSLRKGLNIILLKTTKDKRMAKLVTRFIKEIVGNNPNINFDSRFRVELKNVNSQTKLGLQVNPDYPWIISKVVEDSLISQKGIIAGDVLLSVGTNRNVDEHTQIKSTHTTSDILGFIEDAKKSGQVVLRFAPRLPKKCIKIFIMLSIRFFMDKADARANALWQSGLDTRLKGASLVVIRGLSSPLGITMDKYDNFWIVRQSTNPKIEVGDVIKKVNEDPIRKETDLSRYKNYSLTLVRNMNTQYESGIMINTNEDLGVTFTVYRILLDEYKEVTFFKVKPTKYTFVHKYLINEVTEGGIGDLFGLKKGYGLEAIDNQHFSTIPGIETEKNHDTNKSMLDTQKINILTGFIKAKQEEFRKLGKILQFKFNAGMRSETRNNMRDTNAVPVNSTSEVQTYLRTKKKEEDPKSAIRGQAAGGKRKTLRRKNSSAKTRKGKRRTPATARKRAGHKKASRKK